jgi:hypothetical protein
MSDDLDRRLRATGGKGQGGPLKWEAADHISVLERLLAQADAVIYRYAEEHPMHRFDGHVMEAIKRHMERESQKGTQ